jgi:hypothetical protein
LTQELINAPIQSSFGSKRSSLKKKQALHFDQYVKSQQKLLLSKDEERYEVLRNIQHL